MKKCEIRYEKCEEESVGKLEGFELCRKHFDERHIEIHAKFLRELDIMVADFMEVTNIELPSETSLRRFMEWCSQQAENPTQVNPPPK